MTTSRLRPAASDTRAAGCTTHEEEAPMTTSRTDAPISRRSALAGLGAGGLALALATTARPAAAQEGAGDLAGHPLTGTWAVRWDALPPTLVLTCKDADDPRYIGTTEAVKLVQLDDAALAWQRAGVEQPVRFERPKK